MRSSPGHDGVDKAEVEAKERVAQMVAALARSMLLRRGDGHRQPPLDIAHILERAQIRRQVYIADQGGILDRLERVLPTADRLQDRQMRARLAQLVIE